MEKAIRTDETGHLSPATSLAGRMVAIKDQIVKGRDATLEGQCEHRTRGQPRLVLGAARQFFDVAWTAGSLPIRQLPQGHQMIYRVGERIAHRGELPIEYGNNSWFVWLETTLANR